MTLLSTKLFVPRQHHAIVTRPRLLALLARGLECKLLLVTAPAGFGKTTAVTEWLAQISNAKPTGQAINVCWVSLDEGDNDPARFLTYLVAALQSIAPHIGGGIGALLQAPQLPALPTLFTLLLNDLTTLAAPLICVLDDYHVLTAPPLHEALIFFIERLPPSVHLVITTRVDPPFPLARWRARRELSEVRQQDLRFTQAEAARFLDQELQMPLATDEVAALEQRTEGWIAGLQLAALSMNNSPDVHSFIRAFTGSHAYIIDYLTEEVLQQQATAVETFLLQTAILERLCGPLCDAVTGQTHGKAMLEQLQRANLFVIALDDERTWYRYHHLFGEALRNRLLHQSPQLVATLHRRASHWYAQAGLISEAIHHAFAAGERTLAADLIEQHCAAFTKRGEQQAVAAWIEQLPEPVARTRPRLSLVYVANLIARHRLDTAEEWLGNIQAVFATQPPPQPLLGEFLYQQANVAYRRFDFDRVMTVCEKALSLIAPADWQVRGRLTLILGIAYYYRRGMRDALAMYQQATQFALNADDVHTALYGYANQADVHSQMGNLYQATAAFQQGVQLATARQIEHSSGVNLLYADFTELLYERNDLAAMQLHFQTATKHGIRTLNPIRNLTNQVCLAKIQHLTGEATTAMTTLQQALDEYTSQKLPIENAAPAIRFQVALWCAVDQWAAVRTWRERCVLVLTDEISAARELEYVALAQALIVTGELDQALALVERMFTSAADRGRLGMQIELLALQALALAQAGQPAAAQASLQQALTRGLRGGYFRTFVNMGTPLKQLLTLWQDDKRESAENVAAYVNQLVGAFPPTVNDAASSLTPPSAPITRHRPSTPLIEPLTEREIEVLQLVNLGLSNNQIADRLIVTVGTVKRHLNNIFGKLGASSRTQALVQAKQLDLL